MVTARYLGDNSYELSGLSTDKKPLTYRNGTVFVEIDTGKRYRFDGENKSWGEPVNSGGSGGAGTVPGNVATDDEFDAMLEEIGLGG